MDAPEEPLPPVIYTMENKPIVTCECRSARAAAAAAAGGPVRARRPLVPHGPAPALPAASWTEVWPGGGCGGASDPAGGDLRPRRRGRAGAFPCQLGGARGAGGAHRAAGEDGPPPRAAPAPARLPAGDRRAPSFPPRGGLAVGVPARAPRGGPGARTLRLARVAVREGVRLYFSEVRSGGPRR